ncbi:response regulator [Alteromonas oceanisediminis]|uniref:response regulator n=1 Tax=Alteromonas oceanisediminis TaxID=2836180 RepID=UPI001BDA497F|nr:response regulator [Alteromonas oceanisediminis]MBT0585849.1 response regulator [Alteromonas oceanisediminis]
MNNNDVNQAPWVVLSVEDNPDYQASLVYTIEHMKIRHRPVVVLTANSCEQACAMVLDRSDISVALVDMVMEDDTAGLRFIQYVRHTLHDDAMRMVMLTGEPGIAPRRLMVECDVDEYWNKSELQNDKLYSVLCSQTRTWAALKERERNQHGLKIAIESAQQNIAKHQYEKDALSQQVDAVLERLTTLYSDQPAVMASIRSSVGMLTDIQHQLRDVTPTASVPHNEICQREDFDLTDFLSVLADTVETRFDRKHLTLVCPCEPLPTQKWVNGYQRTLREFILRIVDTALTQDTINKLIVSCGLIKATAHRLDTRFSLHFIAPEADIALQRAQAELDALFASDHVIRLAKQIRTTLNVSLERNVLTVHIDVNFYVVNRPVSLEPCEKVSERENPTLLIVSNDVDQPSNLIQRLSAMEYSVITANSFSVLSSPVTSSAVALIIATHGKLANCNNDELRQLAHVQQPVLMFLSEQSRSHEPIIPEVCDCLHHHVDKHTLGQRIARWLPVYTRSSGSDTLLFSLRDAIRTTAYQQQDFHSAFFETHSERVKALLATLQHKESFKQGRDRIVSDLMQLSASVHSPALSIIASEIESIPDDVGNQFSSKQLHRKVRALLNELLSVMATQITDTRSVSP